MVKGGYARHNAPKNKKDKSIPEEEIDYAYKLSNDDIMFITKTSGIKNFCDKQHLKYIAHAHAWRTIASKNNFFFAKRRRAQLMDGKNNQS